MDMDSSSWLHGYADNTTGNSGFMCGYAASCTPAELQYREEQQQQQLISSQIQHHLNQISMHMSMDDEAVFAPSNNDGAIMDDLLDSHHAAGAFPSSSSSSSLSLRSASLSCSPESSAHILAAPAAAGCQYPEVSSNVPLAHVAPYDHWYTNLHVPAPPEAPANTGAFKRYARHLGPRRPTKPGACGQRMFKTAMSVLAKMHIAARYNQQHYYEATAEAAAPPSVNQLQHMISERKRREKLNDSFHALKTVLPPGAKKDKTSILIRAREYVKSLESKVSELEAKNKSLESRLVRRDNGDGKDGSGDNSGENVQIEITRAAKEEWSIEPRDLCTIKIVVMSRCNMTDVVLKTLQCLKDQMGDDVSLVAMSTSGASAASPRAKNTSPRSVLSLKLKSPGAKWEEQPVKDAVAKVVADVMTLSSAETAAAPR
ncbi:hypothetical protein ACP70R_030639 [Stipagrostis hirtigluma subsp. patula]